MLTDHAPYPNPAALQLRPRSQPGHPVRLVEPAAEPRQSRVESVPEPVPEAEPHSEPEPDIHLAKPAPEADIDLAEPAAESPQRRVESVPETCSRIRTQTGARSRTRGCDAG